MAYAKVLVVEDDAIVAKHLEHMLLQKQYEVVALAASGDEAVKMAGALVPDIILMDIYLQGEMNGIRAAEQIRKQNEIPIIFVSAYSDSSLLQQAQDCESYGYLVKPIQDKELHAAIEMALYRHRTERTLKHLTQVLQAVREVNQLIVHEKDPAVLLNHACQVIVGTRGHCIVWIERIENDFHFLRPVAFASGCEFTPILTWSEEAIDQGPYQATIRNGQPLICNAIATDENGLPFRKEALEHGFSSLAIIPMLHEKHLYGLMNVASNQPNAFNEEEVGLLFELAGDLAFALKGIAEEVARQETEKSLRESDERYRRVIETTSEGIWALNDQLKPLYANPHLAEMFGYSAEELVSGNVADFLFPEDVPNHERRMAERREGKAECYEQRLRRKDGKPLWAIVSATPIITTGEGFSGTLAMFTDITERKEAEEALQKRFVELSVIYENSLALTRIMPPEETGKQILGLISSRLNWYHAVVRLMNQATGKLDIIAFSHSELSEEEIQRETERLNRLIAEPGQGLSGWVIQHGKSVCCEDVSKDARYVCSYSDICSGLYVPIRVGDYTIGCISVESTQLNAFGENEERLLTTLALQAGISITNYRLYRAVHDELFEHRRDEEALRVLNDQLEQRVDERTEELRQVNVALERASRMKDEFLASMSHELRTPLTGVLNLSEVLQEQIYGPLNTKQLELAQTIENSGRHLLGLINDILDLSKIEAGQFELQRDWCSVHSICQASLEMVKGMAQKKRITITFESPSENIQLMVDARRFKQMLVNLLSNAVKFTPEGGKIGLVLKADAKKQEVAFTIWDSGIGISPADMARLFRPFTQLDNRFSRQQPGTGLGLALVKRMADMHGGSVQVQSIVGEGSHFTVTMPWVMQAAPAPEMHEEAPGTSETQPAGQPDGQAERPRILIADDNEINLETYAGYLSAKGYEVIKAYHGQEAVQNAQQYHPDIILMDIQMPEMDGLQAIQLIRASTDRTVSEIPILALTALAMTGDRERCLNAGANGYISKPVSLKELLRSVQEYVKNNGAHP